MAKIVLEIVADGSQVESALGKMATGFTKVNDESKKLRSDTAKGFKEVATEAKKANEEIASPKVTDAQKKSLSAVQQLKNEIKAYEAAALKAGEGTAAFAKNIALAGAKKAELKDLKEAISALDPDAVAKSFLGLASSMAGGFAVAQGAIALTGQKSEDLEKALLKVQAAQAILSGLQAVANFKDEAAKVKIILLNKLIALETRANIVATQMQVAVTGEQIVATEVQTGAVVQLTVAQRVLNLVMKANPVLLLVTALGALAIAAGLVAEKYFKQKTEAEKLEEAYQNLIKANKSIIEGIDNEILALEGLKSNEAAILELKKERARITLEEAKAGVEASIKNVEAIQAQAKAQNDLNIFQKIGQMVIFSGADQDIAIKEKQKKALDQITERNKTLAKTIAENSKAANELTQAELDKIKEAKDKALQAKKEYQDMVSQLNEKAAQEEINQLAGEAKIRAIEASELKKLDAYKATFTKRKALTEEQEKQFALLENGIRLKANQESAQLRQEEAAKIDSKKKAAAEKALAEQEKAFSTELGLIEKHNQALILLTEENSVERINAQIKAVEEERDFRITNAKLTADELIIIQKEAANKIIALQKELQDKNKFSFAKLLGVTDEQLSAIKDQLNKALGSVKQIIDQQLQAEQDALDKRKEINDEVIKNADDRLKTLNDQLKTELELNAQGFASNVDAVREEIALTNAERAKGLAEEQRIAAEQEKIKKRQAIADSLSQASSLLSAGATLFAQGALKGPAGIATAVATIAAMIASFLALKSKLSEAGFKDGGYTGDGGENEVAGSVHGKEFVSTAKTTKKHRNLLEAMHNDNFSGLTISDLQPVLNGVKFNTDVLGQIDNEQSNYVANKATQGQAMLSVMASTNKQLSKFFNHVKNKPTETRNSKGDIVIKNGNTTRIIKAKK